MSSSDSVADPLLSIVIPCYNEEGNIGVLYKRLSEVVAQAKIRAEFLFVDDGSQDNTWRLIEGLSIDHPGVIGVKLSRNFGHQNAVSAGIDTAQGDVLVIIDADLQDPPELIINMLDKWREGYHVVYAVRRHRKGEGWFKLFTARLFYRFLRRITDVDIPLDTGDFRLIDKQILLVLKALKEKNRFIRGLISWIGFKQTGIPYDRDKRYSGETKYPLKKMLKFAVDGITSFSSAPLKLATYVGFFSAILSLLFVLYSFLVWLFVDSVIPGWTSTITAVLFLGGIQLISLGIIGEYIRRIYDEAKDRPNFIIEQIKRTKGSSDE
jgi:polyisoprenyl-phosphate glycosyltransferase